MIFKYIQNKGIQKSNFFSGFVYEWKKKKLPVFLNKLYLNRNDEFYFFFKIFLIFFYWNNFPKKFFFDIYQIKIIENFYKTKNLNILEAIFKKEKNYLKKFKNDLLEIIIFQKISKNNFFNPFFLINQKNNYLYYLFYEF